jgi:hypothetical protein
MPGKWGNKDGPALWDRSEVGENHTQKTDLQV